MANPESPKDPETLELEQETKELKKQVTLEGDRRKFESLLKDPNVQSGITKIMEKGLSFEINNFEKTYNKYSKESVDYYTCDSLLKKKPKLISLIGWELGLPVNRSKKIKFSELSLEQKLGFMALMNVYWDMESGFEKTREEDIISKYVKYRNDFSKKAAESLDRQMKNNKVVGNLVKFEKVMKTDYGLTDSEYKKMEEYLALIANHPEYVGGEMKQIIQLTAPRQLTLVKWVLAIGIPFALGILLGYNLNDYIDKVYSIEEPKMKESKNGKVTVKFTDVMQEVPGYSKVSNDTLTFSKEAYGYYNEDTGQWVEKQGKKVLNFFRKVGNQVQKREVTVVSNAEVGYFYDGKKISIDVEKKDGKGYITIRLQEDPELKVTNRKYGVLNSKRELIPMERFNNFDFDVSEKMDSIAKSHAATKERRKNADASLRKNTLAKFQSFGYCTNNLQIPAEDFVDAHIVYEGSSTDPEKLPDENYPDSEGRGWKKIE